MEKIKVQVLNKKRILALTKFALILALAMLAPFFKFQFVTGPLVNALLFITTVILGPTCAILIGLIPSVFALSTGLLPFILAPLIPFIMLSNTLLVVVFNYFQKRNYWLGIGLASLFKFVFLFASSQILVNLFIKHNLAKQAAMMMNWPQLATALAGGVIAYIFLRFIKIKAL